MTTFLYFTQALAVVAKLRKSVYEGHLSLSIQH